MERSPWQVRGMQHKQKSALSGTNIDGKQNQLFGLNEKFTKYNEVHSKEAHIQIKDINR